MQNSIDRLMHPSEWLIQLYYETIKNIYIIYWYSSHDRICAEKNKTKTFKCLKANMETMKC